MAGKHTHLLSYSIYGSRIQVQLLWVLYYKVSQKAALRSQLVLRSHMKCQLVLSSHMKTQLGKGIILVSLGWHNKV